MKKKFLTTWMLVLAMVAVQAQTPSENELIVRKVADGILKEAVFAFEGKDGKTYQKAKDIPKNVEANFKSKYGAWHYTNGVINLAMLNLGDFLNEQKYTNYALQHVAFGFDNYQEFQKRYTGDRPHHQFPFGQLWTMKELDDAGAMGASIIKVYEKQQRPEYKTYIDNTARHILERQDRLKDGTLARTFPRNMTVWADDLYMAGSFTARMGKMTGDKKYYDDAIKQIENQAKYLWNENNGLHYHCYYSDLDRTGVAHWGRSNGWLIVAQANLLEVLPKDHPKRPELIRLLERQIVGLSRHQNKDGLWHQLLDKPDSYPESSATAMFVYGVAKAVNEGWIAPTYASIATTGWNGLKKHMITEDGQMKDVCVGTGISDDLVFYYNRPAGLNEKHGTGSLIDAGIEIIKLERARAATQAQSAAPAPAPAQTQKAKAGKKSTQAKK